MSLPVYVFKLGSLFAFTCEIARERPGGFLQVEHRRELGETFVTIGPLFLTFNSPAFIPRSMRI